LSVAARLSTCWVVTDGKAGMESQCVGLAEALGVATTVKRVAMRAPWRELSPFLRVGLAHAFRADGDPLEQPWPDILIATGRLSVPASLYVRAQSRRAGKRTLTVQIQNPVIAPSHFDLVVAPLHDRLRGDNVISTIGALHRVTPGRLARDAAEFAPQAAHLARPYIGVLVGGPNAAYRFGPAEARRFGSKLTAIARELGASLLVTPSRRTGGENLAVLKNALGDAPAFVWTGEGSNPYYGILGLADILIVTSDSVNMISEACATGRPVYVYGLPGGSKKFDRFHCALRDRGLARPFAGTLERFSPPHIDEMSSIVEAIRRLA
jgi:uncharacterized protein